MTRAVLWLLGVLHWRTQEPLTPDDPDLRDAYDHGRLAPHALTGYRFD